MTYLIHDNSLNYHSQILCHHIFNYGKKIIQHFDFFFLFNSQLLDLQLICLFIWKFHENNTRFIIEDSNQPKSRELHIKQVPTEIAYVVLISWKINVDTEKLCLFC